MDSGSVLVVAAHPDDEVLGCGGTIAGMADAGRPVHIALLADGVGARFGADAATANSGEQVARRRDAAHLAAQILGAKSVTFGDFPDNRLDSVDLLDLARTVEELIERMRPTTVVTHFAGDVNIDHRRIHDAVVVACRPQPDHPVCTLLHFEVASSTEWQLPSACPAFAPNWFVDIGAQLERRQAALAAYHEEMRPWPHARSLEALLHRARWRGATIGVEAAEAFMLGRHIVRTL
jgi:LmbE family N-acetylglucosaminyl deacetylase